MKKSKLDSEILDDNYFLEEEKKSFDLKKSLGNIFRVIGYLILNTTFHIFSLFFLFLTVNPLFYSFGFMTKTLAINLTLILSYLPFIFWFCWELKEENLLKSNRQIWVAILTFFIFLIIRYLVFEISDFRIG